MKKIAVILIALVMLLTASAFATSANWVDLDLTEFTVTVPEDIIGYVADTYVADEPFAAFYQDYNPDRVFNRNLAFAYTEEVLDIYSMSPVEIATYSVEGAVDQFAAMGIEATNPTVIDASIGLQDGREVLFMMYNTTLDYSGVGYDEIINMYTIQMIAPLAERGRSYIVTLTTDDVEASEMLLRVSDTIKW